MKEKPGGIPLSREFTMFTVLNKELVEAHDARNKAQAELKRVMDENPDSTEKQAPAAAKFREAHLHAEAVEIAQDALGRHSDVDKAMGQIRLVEGNHQMRLTGLVKQIADMKAAGKPDIVYKLEREQAEHEDGLAAAIEAGKIIKDRDQKPALDTLEQEYAFDPVIARVFEMAKSMGFEKEVQTQWLINSFEDGLKRTSGPHMTRLIELVEKLRRVS